MAGRSQEIIDQVLEQMRAKAARRADAGRQTDAACRAEAACRTDDACEADAACWADAVCQADGGCRVDSARGPNAAASVGRRDAVAAEGADRGAPGGRVYEDEPILQTGAQLAARREREAQAAYRFATGQDTPAGLGFLGESRASDMRGSEGRERPRTLGDLTRAWVDTTDGGLPDASNPTVATAGRGGADIGAGRATRSRWQMTGEVEREGLGPVGASRSVRLASRGSVAMEERIPPRPGSAGAQAGRRAAERPAARTDSAGAWERRGSDAARGPGAGGSRYVPASTAGRRDLSWGDLWSDLATPSSLPEQYGNVRALARAPEARRHSDAWLFCEQGRALADVEDDCPYTGTFERYYPTYNAMTDRQLRGYITWRTQLRRGIVTKTSTSFAFVYIYELLNGIGADDRLDAYHRLRQFWDDYRDLEPAADRYLRSWLRDYVVYHGLPRSLIADDPALSKELILDEALIVVRDATARTPEERFAAWATLSSYRVRSSRFYKEYPADVQAVTLGVMGRLAAHYAKGGRKHDLFETLFGERATLPYEMFRACVFYEERPHADVEYELDAVNRYVCAGGRWTCERYQGNRRESTKLGSILKEIDARMRLRYGYPHPLRDEKTPKYLLGFIEKEIDAWLSWKAAHAPRVIEIDRSKLHGIRGDAATVREELLVDEERGEEACGFGSQGDSADREAPGGGLSDELADGKGAPAGAGDDCASLAGSHGRGDDAPIDSERPGSEAFLATSSGCVALPGEPVGTAAGPSVGACGADEDAPGPAGLTAQELAFVRGLLAGDAAVPPGPVGSLDMLVDAVNERLFDELGDTAVEFDASGRPAIIEDYADDVRGIVGA